MDVKKQQAPLGSPTPSGDSAAYLPRATDKAELWVNEHRGTSFALVGRSPLDATCLDNNSPYLCAEAEDTLASQTSDFNSICFIDIYYFSKTTNAFPPYLQRRRQACGVVGFIVSRKRVIDTFGKEKETEQYSFQSAVDLIIGHR